MTIEHRLQHAARELREVRIDVPPLGGPLPPTRRNRLQALAAPMLFVVGGVLAVGVVQGRAAEPIQTDIPLAPSVVDPGPTTAEAMTASVPAPSVRSELEMIAEIIQSGGPRPVQEPQPASVPAEDVIESAVVRSETVGPS